jgi:adenine/guanine phosphoribosyltransferase-like PRPP-binding protein
MPDPGVTPSIQTGLRFTVDDLPVGTRLDQFFGVARRDNRKRAELFVSRVLGKHIPAPPGLVRAVGTALAERVACALAGGQPSFDLAAAFADPDRASALCDAVTPWPVGGPVLVVGYCETATALGHLVADRLAGSVAVHTSRRSDAAAGPMVAFEEEHSHATSHYLALRDRGLLVEEGTPMVLVDDEFTTGRTVINTISALQSTYPRKRYVGASILDWRTLEWQAALARRCAETVTTAETVALVRGVWEGAVAGPASPAGADAAGDRARRIAARPPAPVSEHRFPAPGPPTRFGWSAGDRDRFEDAHRSVAARLAAWRHGERALCLGTEEFMYPPLRIAEHLGPGVLYQSTTQSPIVAVDVEGYPVRSAAAFEEPIEGGRGGFIYNLVPGGYDDVFVFLDEAVPPERREGLTHALRRAATAAVHVVTLA